MAGSLEATPLAGIGVAVESCRRAVRKTGFLGLRAGDELEILTCAWTRSQRGRWMADVLVGTPRPVPTSAVGTPRPVPTGPFGTPRPVHPPVNVKTALEPGGGELVALTVLVMIVFLPRRRKSTDKTWGLLLWSLNPENPVLHRPIEDSNIHRIFRENA